MAVAESHESPEETGDLSTCPAAIFLTGEQHYHAAEFLTLAIHERGLDFHGPAIVLSAFALELYFKSVLMLEGGQNTRVHNLRELFDRLSDPVQTQIRDAFARHIPQAQAKIAEEAQRAKVPVPNVTFDMLLDESAQAFEKLRYIYEGLKQGISWGASGVLLATREVILHNHPDWADLRLGIRASVEVNIIKEEPHA